MNKISLPNGGFVMYAAFGGHVVQAREEAHSCPECELYKSAGISKAEPCSCEGFVEKTAFGVRWAEIPEKYAAVLTAYQQGNSQLERVAPINNNFSFFRVMGVHGDEFNSNGDLFRWGNAYDKTVPELMRYDERIGKHVYQTFVGKGNYKDHQNDAVSKAVGILLDAVPNQKVKGIELLIAVDKQKDPMLVRGIENGYITDVSMGCRVAYSICSVCDNVAHNEKEYCNHIKHWKGQHYSGPETGWKSVYAGEDNRGVEFIEESWVTVGADRKAKYLEKVAKIRKIKGEKQLESLLGDVESEFQKNSLCDYEKLDALLEEAIKQAIIA